MSEEQQKKTAKEAPGGSGNKGRNHDNGGRFFHRRPKIEGACKELKGCIFDINKGKNVESYSKNVRMIAIHVAQCYTDGGDIRYTIEKMKKYKIDEPDKLRSNASDFQK